MNAVPPVAVIMPTYNEPENYLTESIGSILNQSYSDFEVLIIVDNPVHPCIDLLREYECSDERVRIVCNDRNIGLSASLNKALDIVQSEFICRIDADDISEEERIEKQLAYIERTKIDLVGSYMTVIDTEGRLLYSADRIPLEPDHVAKALRYNNCVPHPTWFGKREYFLLRYRGVPFCEDYDLLLRSVIRGYKVGNVGETLVRYRMSSGSVSRSNLFEQFEFQKYLSGKYANGFEADVDAAIEFVEKAIDDGRARKYLAANEAFNKLLSERATLSFIEVVRLISRSLSYDEKMARLAVVALISELEKKRA